MVGAVWTRPRSGRYRDGGGGGGGIVGKWCGEGVVWGEGVLMLEGSGTITGALRLCSN